MLDRAQTEQWASAVLPPEKPLVAKSCSIARSQLDDCRLELQRLQDQMEERQGVFRLVRALAGRLLKIPLFKLTGHYHRAIHREDHRLQSKAFKPYKLNYRKPPSSGIRPVVVHLIGNFCVGGLPRLLIDIIEWTSDEYEHVVITLHAPVPPAFLGMKVIELGEKTSQSEFMRQMAALNPALVHVHHYAPHSLYHVWHWYRTGVLAAASLHVPVIEGVNVPMIPYYHPAVQAYVFVSNYVMDDFGFKGCANHVIYPGSDFSLFTPEPHGFSDTIGMVYRLDDSKLRKESIDVFVRVLQARASTKAIIVGDGFLLSHFKEQAQKAGLAERFTFTGFISYEKLPELYRRMDVFVAPVFCESFGQVTPFAMNMGIPVAAYATDALPEILDDPAVTAPTGDVEALAKIIVGLLESPDRRSQTAARNEARAKAHFAVEQMTDEYSQLYERLLTRQTLAR